MSESSDRLYTPKELAEKRVLSLVQQWKERKTGRLACYRIGRKILYSERHISDFLRICEVRRHGNPLPGSGGETAIAHLKNDQQKLADTSLDD